VKWLGALVLLAGCNGILGIGNDFTVGDDAPADGGTDGGIDPAAFGTFVVDEITVPIDASTATAYGFDLDGDGHVDNRFGNVYVQLGSIEAQDTVTAAVRDGTVVLLAAGVDCVDGPCLSTFEGINPDPDPCTVPGDATTCGQHLQGTATFDIDATRPTNLATHGSVDFDVFTGTSGSLLMPIMLAGDVIWVSLELAQAELTGLGTTGFGASKFGGAIPGSEVDARLIPAMHLMTATTIQRDCTGSPPPGCGCTTDSVGATMISLFDENDDCVVTLAEYQSNGLITALMAPDIDTDGDGTKDALSMGVQITGVAATYTLP
jgi:hypothetical protein